MVSFGLQELFVMMKTVQMSMERHIVAKAGKDYDFE